MKTIETKSAPVPGGHYSQGVVSGGLLFVAGQLPIDPETGRKETGEIEAQAELTLKNMLAVVEAAGSDLSRIVKTTVYVSDIELWGRVNDVYARFFGDHRPARAVVPTAPLHHGFQIEIECVAAVD